MSVKLRVIILFILSAAISFSQKPDSLNQSQKTENYFRINYDNDLFSGTDRYYTQGIIIDFIHPIIRYSPFSHSLIRLKKSNLNYYGLHLEQDVFTPLTIRHEGIFYGERPYCAVFFISHSLVSINTVKKLRLETQLDLGIMGPGALGAEEQKTIHKATNNQPPLGWQYQVAGDAVINYTARIEKGLFIQKHMELMSSGFVSLGTLYTNLGFGLNARLGIFSPYFNNLGLENNSAQRKNKFKIYAIGRANIRLVGYNATLEGGLINRSSIYTLPPGAVSRLVLDGMGGIVVAYKRLGLEYSKYYITREFKGGRDHGWGHCAITICF